MSYRVTGVPSYLTQVAAEMNENESRQRKAVANEDQKKMLRTGKVNKRWAASNMDLISHGFGVMEDRRTGSVWHVDGEFLIRQDSDEDIEAIIAAL